MFFKKEKPKNYLYTYVIIPSKKEIRSLGLYKCIKEPKAYFVGNDWPILEVFEKSEYSKRTKKLVEYLNKIYNGVIFGHMLGNSLENLVEDIKMDVLMEAQNDLKLKYDDTFENLMKLRYSLENNMLGAEIIKSELEKKTIPLYKPFIYHLNKILKSLDF